MALMFPRIARNFVKNGSFPTDEPTLERALSALAASPEPMCILDPCAGEGVAIANAAHALGREQVSAYAVEYDPERACHAKQLVDKCIQGDLMDSIISRQAFGLLWLNPPYGDISRDASGNIGYQGQGRARLEKLFYQRALPLLQYGGVLIFIIPHYAFDAELVGWLTRHFADLRIYWIAEQLDRGIDVLISNPELVKTGLDLLEFPTIVFMQSGYNVYSLQQASRRSWRIGQKQPVKVIYLGYANTSQMTCLSLMARKIMVSQSTSGDVPDSGLDVLNQDGDSVEVALARQLVA